MKEEFYIVKLLNLYVNDFYGIYTSTLCSESILLNEIKLTDDLKEIKLLSKSLAESIAKQINGEVIKLTMEGKEKCKN